MKIFITGATGYIGSAVAEAFARHGHAVWGLTRSKDKARELEAREIKPVIGTMETTSSYAQAAHEADVLIHCAAELSARYQTLDGLTVSTLLEMARTGARKKAVIYTSGVWLYGGTGASSVDESAALEEAHLIPWRGDHEKKVLDASNKNLRGIVIRPGCVYGRRGGLTGLWFAGASKNGAASVVGAGRNRWAVIHAEDLAELYVRAAESRLGGELFNATDRSRFTVLEMAQAASAAAGAGGKVVHVTVEEAKKSMGIMAQGLALDQHVDSSKAAHMLGWHPRFGGFPERAERYFAAWKASQAAERAEAAV